MELTASNFESTVLKSDEPWLVEFYAPWCGHCKNLAPEWAKAAKALKGIVNLGAVDMDSHGSVGQPYGIKGFPTIKVFGLDKKKPTDYSGARTAQGIVDGALQVAKDMVSARLGGGKSSGSSSNKKADSGSQKEDSGDAVIELTADNFQTEVMQSEDLWLVEFFAPWCGHCKNLVPEWKSAAGQLKGVAKLGAVDATVHGALAQKYDVKGYPTIKVFAAGAKGEPETYEGGRKASDFVSFCQEKASENKAPAEVLELTENGVFESECTNKQICFIAVLPNILDSGAKGRNVFIEILKKLAKNYRKRPFGFVWAEGGAQAELESALSIGGSGYPALVALNAKKKKFSTFRLSFSESTISEFVNQLVVGRASTTTLTALPTITKIAAWDGKDKVVKVEKEIDLSELGDDEEDDVVPTRRKTEL